MYFIKDELVDCAAKLKIRIRILEKNETANIINLIKSRFINKQKKDAIFLWERLTDAFILNDPMAWSYIENFVGNTSCLIIFNDHDSWTIAEINNGSDLTELLGETSGFEFYVVDKELTYVICFNHEDQLLCAGKAKEWINNYILQEFD